MLARDRVLRRPVGVARGPLRPCRHMPQLARQWRVARIPVGIGPLARRRPPTRPPTSRTPHRACPGSPGPKDYVPIRTTPVDTHLLPPKGGRRSGTRSPAQTGPSTNLGRIPHLFGLRQPPLLLGRRRPRHTRALCGCKGIEGRCPPPLVPLRLQLRGPPSSPAGTPQRANIGACT